MQYRENQFNNNKWVIASVSMLSVIGFYFLSNGPTPIKVEAATNIAPNSSSTPNDQGASGTPNDQGASGTPNDQGASGTPNDQGASGTPNDQGASGAANGQESSSTLDVQGTPNKLSANSSLGSVLDQKNTTTELQENQNVSSATSLSVPSSKDISLSPNNVKQTYGLTLSNNNQNNINNLKVNVNVSDPNQVTEVQYDSNIFRKETSGGSYVFTANQYPPVQSNIVFKLTTRSQEDNGNVQPVTIDGNYSYDGSSNNFLPDQVYYVHNSPKGAAQGGGGDPTYLIQGYEFSQPFSDSKYANANDANIGADNNGIHQFYDINKSKTTDANYYQTFEATNNSNPTTLGFSSDNYKIDTSSTRAIIRSNDGKYNYVIDPQNNTTVYNTDGSKVSNEELSSNRNINNEKPLINWDIVNDHQVNISRANSYGSIYYLINHVLVDAQNETDALKANVEVHLTATSNDGKRISNQLTHFGKFVDVPKNYTNGYPFISGVADKTINLTANQPTYTWNPDSDVNSGVVTASVYDASNPAATKFSSLKLTTEKSDNFPSNNIFNTPGTYYVTYSIYTTPDGRGYTTLGGTANINNQKIPITQKITVIKTINNYVNYYDDTSNKLIKTDTLTGSQGSSINYVPDSSILKDSRYKLTSNPLSSNSITLNKENAIYTLHFVHNISHSSEQKDVTATVKYQTTDGKEIAPNDEQRLSFSRDVAHDPVNNTDTYGQWNPNNNSFNQVTSPQIANYSPDKTVIASIPNINGDSSNIVNYVTYRLINNGSDISPSTPNTNNNSNSQIPNANDDNSNPQSSNNHIKPNHSKPNKHYSHKKYHGIIGKRIYAIKGLNMYRKNYFIYKYKIRGFHRHIRINRPMFKVIDYARSSKGILRYKVIRISPYTNRIIHGRNNMGYITARRNYVTKLYYEKNVRKIKVIAKGINEYKHLNLTKKIHGYKKNRILKVKSVRKMGTIYRLKLYNNDYITANKRYVKIIK